MTSLTQLIQSLQEATGPSRELDARIWCVVQDVEFIGPNAPFYGDDYGFLIVKDGREFATGLRKTENRFTASLDAITALIERELPGTCWSAGIHRASDPRRYTACLETDEEYLIERHPTSAALALCIAFLSALQARGARHG